MLKKVLAGLTCIIVAASAFISCGKSETSGTGAESSTTQNEASATTAAEGSSQATEPATP